MKILIATGLYAPEIGGPATYTRMLEENLPDRGFVVQVLPFSVVKMYPKVIRHMVYGWKLWRGARQVDMVLALDPVSVGVPAVLVAWLADKTFVLRVPGDYAWEQGQLRFGVTDRLHDFIEKRFGYGLRVTVLCWVESWVAKRAKRVIVPSNYLKKIVKKWGVQKDKLSVVYSALHPIKVTASPVILQKKYNFASPTLISIGRLVPNKGFVDLLRVFKTVVQTVPQAQLVIVGDGPEEKAIHEAVQDLQLTDAVTYMGALPKQTLGEVITAADLFVLNTAHEGLSHQIIEVMSLQTPIVTTNVGGNPELIVDREHGRLVEYGDAQALEKAIIETLQQPQVTNRMIQRAKKRSDDFSLEQAIDQFVAVVQSVNV